MVLRKLIIERPLIFLCGPYFNKGKPTDEYQDKREIFKNYIIKNKNDDLQPLPIIIDQLFNDDKPSIDLGLLEEVIANISSKTYIFLDTMSTSYELGLFDNSKQRNNVKVLLDNEYKNRVNCQVGQYIEKSQEKNIIKYQARYNSKGYIYFIDNKLPKVIADEYNDTFNNLLKCKETELKLIDGFNDESMFGDINYKFDEDNNNLNFQVDIKTLFYLLGDVMDYYHIADNPTIDEVYNYIIKKIVDVFCYFSKKKEIIKKLIFDESITYNLYLKDYSTKEILNILLLILNYFNDITKDYPRDSIKKPFTRNYYQIRCKTNVLNEMDLFGITIDDLIDIKKYNKFSNHFVNSFFLQYKCKKRKIITYKNNHNGEILKNIHSKINKSLEYLPTSSNSYAYKKEHNIKMCIEKHIESESFAKFDIHDFFGSIKKSTLVDIIITFQKEKVKNFLNKLSLNTYYYNWLIYLDKTMINDILSVSFYKYELPVGYITSPKLSDFILYDFDNDVDKICKHDALIYTRYADDLLISKTKKDKLNYLYDDISELLSYKKLALNDKKTKFANLNKSGDTFKFLGLVLMKRDTKPNVIKISNNYIKFVSIECNKLLSVITYNEYESIIGMINYIKYISDNSFDKLNDLFRIKNGIDLKCAINNVKICK